MQNWDLSCGAAALTTLLQYQFGDTVTEREVATGLINRDVYIANPILVQLRQGFSLLDLKRYVDKRGYLGMGFGGMSLQDLERRAPVLIPVNITGYNHFVIFRGRLGDRVLLADPAWGNRTMTLARFERVWIDYLDLGRVGFVVAHKGKPAGHPPAQLAPRESDFVTLN
ncbi:C39 family peptidase [Pseudohalioglobus sediminis]|uniref:C39 family peptidase n=2 Tax=Pseudohalioglobus sediminis TaxID=2606449 RepID=A0A5B0X0B0_9GAMM|nr:C39 family peptidase [Pseudohalioglobus sediminis]